MKLTRIFLVGLFAFGFAMTANAGSIADDDGDGVPTAFDNCINDANGPGESPNNQIDSDVDTHGNRCDADYDQSDTDVDFDDFDLFLAAFSGPGNNIYDHDYSGGDIDFDDFDIFLALFSGPPGG